jgi:pimeloyl-ACP methyl ester carboxylesterase
MINSAGSYQPLRPRQLDYQEIRGHRYALHRWPGSGDGVYFLLHGFGDCAPAFEMLVDRLPAQWTVIAPDWRGFGASAWSESGYWFPDYLADLDAIIETIGNGAAANLIGHSMGGNVAGLYAGIRPSRVARLAVLDGFGLPDTVPEQAPDRYAKWLGQAQRQEPGRVYTSVEELAGGIAKRYPELTPEMALFAAGHWTASNGNGGWTLKSDPTHRWTNPILYRRAEAMACWRRITATVLLCHGDVSRFADDADKVAQILAESGNDAVTKVVLPNIGHMLHLQAPEQCAEVLAHFFQETID